MQNLMLIAFATLALAMGGVINACPDCESKATVAAEKVAEAKATVAKPESSECCGSGCCDARPSRISSGQLVAADVSTRSKPVFKRISAGQLVIADLIASGGCGGCGGCDSSAKAASSCDGCETVAQECKGCEGEECEGCDICEPEAKAKETTVARG
jgi:hypothetical protein